MKLLYLDCQAGIAGDMTLAALLDLGVPLADLQDALASLPLPAGSFALALERTSRQGLAANRLQVTSHEHHPHRHLGDIRAIIDASPLPAPVRQTAIQVFTRLAEAEARVHGSGIEEVHFHEVGAIDAMVDIVGVAFCLEQLGIERLHASSLPLGSGFVDTAHGRLPVPAPATADLLTGLPVHPGPGPGERVTPTGAALVATLAHSVGPPPPFTLERIGYGAGSRDYPETPNVLRALLGTCSADLSRDRVSVLETHLDDATGELLGYLMEQLFAAGALDVAFTPLQMKKNRPGTAVTVLVAPEREAELARLLLMESTASGVRCTSAARWLLPRRVEERQSSLGPVRVKVIGDGASGLRLAPEFDDCRRLAREHRLPLPEIYRRLARELEP